MSAQQDVSLERSEESWGSLHEQYEEIININNNKNVSKVGAAV